MREDMERRRMEAAERMKSLSTSSAEGEEAFSPKVSTHKVIKTEQHDFVFSCKTVKHCLFLLCAVVFSII